jgi:ATP:cob(I)alamin adenosyltransferase
MLRGCGLSAAKRAVALATPTTRVAAPTRGLAEKKRFKIYTKTGDLGTSALYTGPCHNWTPSLRGRGAISAAQHRLLCCNNDSEFAATSIGKWQRRNRALTITGAPYHSAHASANHVVHDHDSEFGNKHPALSHLQSTATPTLVLAPSHLPIHSRTNFHGHGIEPLHGGARALASGERRPKNDPVFEALGSTDELASFIGYARTHTHTHTHETTHHHAAPTHTHTHTHTHTIVHATRMPLDRILPPGVSDGGPRRYAREHCVEAGNALPPVLELIQGHIQELNSHIATPRESKTGEGRLARTVFPVRYAEQLETEIDALDDYLPPLTNFILASGGKASASLQYCRALARRAERTITPLLHSQSIDPAAFQFINRLSDYLFMAGRAAAKHEGKEERIYRPPEH